MNKKKNNSDKISLKDYFNDIIIQLEKHIDMRFNNIEISTKLATENLNLRLESMNEFRESMKDQTNYYVNKVEFNVIKAKYDEDIRMLREANAEMKGKASQQSVIYTAIIASFSIAISIIAIILKF